jgi:hypothetical protein
VLTTNYALEVAVVPLDVGAPIDPIDDVVAGAELVGIGEATVVDVASSVGGATPVAKTPAEAVVDAPAAELDAEDVAEEVEPDGAGVVVEAEPVEGVPAVTKSVPGPANV